MEGGGARGHHGCVCPQRLPEREGDHRKGFLSRAQRSFTRRGGSPLGMYCTWRGRAPDQAMTGSARHGVPEMEGACRGQMMGKGTTRLSCRAHMTHDPRAGALQCLHMADTPSFLRGASALGLQCLPPSSVAPLAWDPSMGFPGAAALPLQAAPTSSPFFTSWRVASGRPQVRPRVESPAITVGWRGNGHQQPALPSSALQQETSFGII